MTDAASILTEFRSTLDDVIELLTAHRVYGPVAGLQNLHALAGDDTVPAAEALAQLDRSYWQFMGIPDGFSATYLQDETGVDRAATGRLDALRTRLAALLREGV